jgi:dolichol kinase
MINESLVLFAAAFTLVLIAIELAKRYFDWVPENSRKLAHIATSLLISIMPLWLTATQIILLAGTFIGLLIFTKATKVFTSVQSVKRTTYGEFAIAVAAVVSALVFLPLHPDWFMIGFLVLAFSDTAAEFAGKKQPIVRIEIFKQPKSLGGSSIFAVTAIIICVLAAEVLKIDYNLAKLCIGLASVTLVEAFLVFGLDNAAIPVATGLAIEWATF